MDKRTRDKYNQYTQFEQIPRLLKRFSFAEKVRMCHIHSKEFLGTMSADDYEKRRGFALPWVVETIFLFSIEAKEYKYECFLGKNAKKFINMLNAVWDMQAAILDIIPENEFVNYFLPLTGLTQFDLQEFYWFKCYRYWRLFNFSNDNINVKQAFRECFNTDYEDFLLIGLCLMTLCRISIKNLSRKAISYLVLEKFAVAGHHLSIKRNDYITELRKMVSSANNLLEYAYCVRPSYKYAFIEEDDTLFFPLPHLIIRNITSALFYRLTDPSRENGNKLRELIGKNALECYLYDLVCETCIYDEVKKEVSYKLPKNNHTLSPDVMIRYNNSFLFMDSKSTVPKSGIRLLNYDDYDKTIYTYAENMNKLYHHIINFPDRLNPFSYSDNISKYNVWGIVVVLEDSYIPRKAIYNKLFEMLDNNSETYDAEWISKHIVIVDLYQVERMCFTTQNIICELENHQKTGDQNDIIVLRGNSSETNNKNFIEFQDNMTEQCKEILLDMASKNLLLD